MKVTVVSLCDNGSAEKYVGVVLGTVPHEARLALAARFSAFYGDGWPGDDEPWREAFFREVDAAESAGSLPELLNESDWGDSRGELYLSPGD